MVRGASFAVNRKWGFLSLFQFLFASNLSKTVGFQRFSRFLRGENKISPLSFAQRADRIFRFSQCLNVFFKQTPKAQTGIGLILQP